MKSVYGVSVPVTQLQLRDYVEVRNGEGRAWVRVDRINVKADGTHEVGVEGSKLFVLAETATVWVRHWVD